jgi:transposase-like protein
VEKRVFSKEYKAKILELLQPPDSKSVPEIAQQEGIPTTTIYSWVSRARKDGQVIPNNGSNFSDRKWNNEDKLRIVIETFALNEAELGQYCRERGLYSTDIKRWRQVLESSFNSVRSSKGLEAELKACHW